MIDPILIGIDQSDSVYVCNHQSYLAKCVIIFNLHLSFDYSQLMSSVRFPAIQTKKSIAEEEEYNFVSKKKKTQGNPIEIIDELRHKIEEHKKEIETRNLTIQGLQRNFESLSTIVKNQKAQSALLRAELDSYRTDANQGEKRATEMHEKCILLQNQLRSLKEELKMVRKSHAECGNYQLEAQELRKRSLELQQSNSQLQARLRKGEMDRKLVQIEVSKLRGAEKEIRGLREAIVDLEEEIKRASDQQNGLATKNGVQQSEIAQLRNEVGRLQKKLIQVGMKHKEAEKRKHSLEEQTDKLQRENSKLMKELSVTAEQMGSKDLVSRVREEQEDRLKRELKQVSEWHEAAKKDAKDKSQLLELAYREIEIIRGNLLKSQQIDETERRETVLCLRKLGNQLYNLTAAHASSLEQTHQSICLSIEDASAKLQQFQSRYGHLLRLIAKNQPDVIITNQREMARIQNSSTTSLAKFHTEIAQLQRINEEQLSSIATMKRYIQSLEKEVESKSQELIDKNRMLRQFQSQGEELSRVTEHERQTQKELEQIIKAMKMRETQTEKECEKERQDWATKLDLSHKKIAEYEQLIADYKLEEENLKQMMQQEHNQLKVISKEKEEEIARMIREKETEIEKERAHNKQLWSDNKKLKDMKDMEVKMKEEADRLLQETERKAQLEIDRLKQQLQERESSVQLNRTEESSSSELRRILQEKATQMKLISENYDRLQGEAEFYKSRNKELEGVVTRTEKIFNHKISEAEKELKMARDHVQLSKIKIRETEEKLAETSLKQKKEVKLLYEQIEDLKSKMKERKTEEKLQLVQRSLGDLGTSLQTLMNTLSCCFCIEVVKECVRMECGHIYCRKCRAGYEPNCGECKKKSSVTPDRLIDDSVSKAQYMKILLTTIEDDLSKIGQK